MNNFLKNTFYLIFLTNGFIVYCQHVIKIEKIKICYVDKLFEHLLLICVHKIGFRFSINNVYYTHWKRYLSYLFSSNIILNIN